MHLNQMYSRLNPNQRREVQIEADRQRRIEELEAEFSRLNSNQRREVQIEADRQRRIEELEAELRKALRKVCVWKSTLCAFAVVVSLILALK